jgi:peptide chain release factor 3
VPSFPPERFATLRPVEGRHKKFDEAVNQLAEEGLLQVFRPVHGSAHPVVGVVGALQFDVIAARMGSEYGIPCQVDVLAYTTARWPVPVAGTPAGPLKLPFEGVLQATDRLGRPVLLFASEWGLNRCLDQNPDMQFFASL